MKLICDIFNNFFLSISNLFPSVCPSFTIPFIRLSLNYFYFKTVSPYDVDKYISKLKKTSPGYDNLSAQTLENLIPWEIEHFTCIINKIITKSVYPPELKIARIIPIYKSGERNLTENYRPIAILPVYSKLIEKILCNQLMDYLNNTHFFNSNQFGFLKGSDTAIASINLIQHIQESIDKGKITATLFIDLRKAFDTIKHILIDKISKMNLCYDAVLLLKSFLNNRKQFVKLNNDVSDTKTIQCGVPQGSVLAAPLFIIFINDIFDINLKGKIQLYADDIAITYSCNSVNILKEYMQQDLESLQNYFDRNMLIMNEKKSYCIVFRTRENKLDNLIITINNKPLQRVGEVKYLGLVISKELNWVEHINKIKKKIIPFVGVFKRLMSYLPQKTLINIYYAHIHTHLTYMSPIWASAPKYKIKELCVLQNKVIKLILRKPRLTPSISLYGSMFMSLENIIKFNQIILIYKIQNQLIRHNIQIKSNFEVHGYNTRTSYNLRLRSGETCIGTNSILNGAIEQYNDISNALQNLDSFKSFKSELKRCLK